MKIKDTLDKLQSIDAKDLNPKNIDSQKLKTLFKEKPNLFLIIILITLTLSATIFLLLHHKKAKEKLGIELSSQQKKLALVNDDKQIQEAYDNFVNDLPKSINSEDLIAKLNDFALANNIKIKNFSPSKPDKQKNIQFETIEVNIVADKYDDLIAFAKSLENSNLSVRIQSFDALPSSGNNTRNKQKIYRDTDEIPIKISLTLTAITITP